MTVVDLKNSVGLVKAQHYTIEEGIRLECGAEFGPVTLAFETYGELNAAKDNAILILHPFTGDAHAAGFHDGDDISGWWEGLIGPGKAFDTTRFFVVASNVLGGCKGSTGPSSMNPKTNKPYALDFPVITVEDMVHAQKRLIEHFEINSLIVAGGSMGGMQALQWAILYPEVVKSAIVIASTARLSVQAVALNEVARNAIMLDPAWKNGNYYGSKKPIKGLSLARMMGQITYLGEKVMEDEFVGELQGKSGLYSGFDTTGNGYLTQQSMSFAEQFDANSYLYLSRALDLFNIPIKYGSIENAFKNSKAKFLVMPVISDLLFPPSCSKELVRELENVGKDVTYYEIQSAGGHDAFIYESKQQTDIIKKFLETYDR